MVAEEEETIGSSGFAMPLPLSILTVFLGAVPFLEDSPEDPSVCVSGAMMTASLDVGFF